MSTWHDEVSTSLSDAVSSVLTTESAESQNKMMRKGKGEPIHKPTQELPEEDKLDPVNPKASKKKFADRKDKDIDNDGDEDASDKYLHKRRKAIGKAIANEAKKKTSKDGKKVNLSGEEEDITVNPPVKEEADSIIDAYLRKVLGEEDVDGTTPKPSAADRARGIATMKANASKKRTGIWKHKVGSKPGSKFHPDSKQDEEYEVEEGHINEEALEASFDTIFQYSNKEEQAYREQWTNEFNSLVSEKEPNAYLDLLQTKVLYIEGLTPQQAASRYLSSCIANAAMAGGAYQKSGTRGGDASMSSQNQGQEVGNAVPQRHQVKS